MKPPSATNSSPPENITFFIDRALGRHAVADALRAAGAQVEIHIDHFADNAPDAQWLVKVAQLNWVVLTKDSAIRYNAIERNAILNSGLRAFVYTSANVPAAEFAQTIAQALPSIYRFIQNHPAPFIATIYRDGAVNMWPPKKRNRGKK